MEITSKTKRFDINLKKPYATYYTAVASDEKRVLELLKKELKKDKVYSVDDFEIEELGEAKDQMGHYFEESFNNEM